MSLGNIIVIYIHMVRVRIYEGLIIFLFSANFILVQETKCVQVSIRFNNGWHGPFLRRLERSLCLESRS